MRPSFEYHEKNSSSLIVANCAFRVRVRRAFGYPV